MNAKILIIEDDHQIRRVIEGYLQQAGFEVIGSSDGIEGFALIQSIKPEILILDLMLPGMDGLEITRRLRGSSDPAIASLYLMMVTARVEETDHIKGLEIGADDYVTKPFSPRELVARVRAALRRIELHRQASADKQLIFGSLCLDPIYHHVTLDGVLIELTETEFDMLALFMRHPGRPFSRAALLDHTQTDAYSDQAAFERTIDAHIKNLRHKLGESGRQGRFIETVHGVGYRFVPPVQQEPTP
ncbi:MAG: response regulator transcription factor [Caldilineaceae bacterium]